MIKSILTKIVLALVIIFVFSITGLHQKKVPNAQKKVFMVDGITYVNDILLVNKKYGLPKDYDPKVNKEAYKNVLLMQRMLFY